MKRSPTVFKAGTRPSSLALTQARGALDRIESLLEGVHFEMIPIASIGDADRAIDLRDSPVDFFTRELDSAVLNGEIDLAIHSAKDLPDPMPKGIDWFWLPWREEPRDVLVLAKDRTLSALPANPVVGVSSERRAEYCGKRFPGAVQQMIRGNIEERIAQVDNGRYDVVIMAAAALVRLGLEDRITQWISTEELEVPDGQGFLAVTFRAGNRKMIALRDLFIRSVTFAGAGVGDQSRCTVATLHALQRCDICLHDSLIDKTLLDHLPPQARTIDVGKRCGAHSREQQETTRLICESARRSQRVVRLKSGDPGIFGRLAEETGALEELDIPYRVIPGISALQAATTGTGMLPTRRDVSRGFVALTPRMSGGALAPCGADVKSRLPVIYYMSIKALEPIARELLEEGWPDDTPAALVFNAGGGNEQIIKTSLGRLPDQSLTHCTRQPGLIMIGDITTYSYSRNLGALSGRKVLVTCSDAIQQKAMDHIHDLGGQAVPFPLIRLDPKLDLQLNCSGYDWVVITSPSSVRALMTLVEKHRIDFRSLPGIMVCGRGTGAALEHYGLYAEVQPVSGFSAQSLLEAARQKLRSKDRVLRVRSDKAGPLLAESLRDSGAEIDDVIIYENRPIRHEELPDFDAVFFASASAVESFIHQWGAAALKGKTICVIGLPTARALNETGVEANVIAREATVIGAINSLAEHYTGEALCSPKSD